MIGIGIDALSWLPLVVVAAGASEAGLPYDNQPALPFYPGISIESQCGRVNEQQDVETYDGNLGLPKRYVAAHEPSTVQLQWQSSRHLQDKLPHYLAGNVAGHRWCTGTLIDRDLVLTAGHCFEPQRRTYGWITPFKFDHAGGRDYAPAEVLATLQRVNVRYQVDGVTGSVRKVEHFPVIELVEYGPVRRAGLDYAIIRIGADARGRLPTELEVPVVPAAVITTVPTPGDVLAIIQHPQGRPKKVDVGIVGSVAESGLLYSDIDTHAGSSGAGVRNEDGGLVAVHTNGGCRTDGGANRGEPNYRISEVSDVF